MPLLSPRLKITHCLKETELSFSFEKLFSSLQSLRDCLKVEIHLLTNFPLSFSSLVQEPVTEPYQAVPVAAEPVHSLPAHPPAPEPEQHFTPSTNAAPEVSTPLPTVAPPAPIAHSTPAHPSTPTRQVLEQPQQQQATTAAVVPPVNLTYADLLKQKKLAPLPSSPAPPSAPTTTPQRGPPHRDNHHHNNTSHAVADTNAPVESVSFPTEHRAAAQQQPAATPAAVGSAVDKAIGGGKQAYSNGNGPSAPRRAPREKLDSDLDSNHHAHSTHTPNPHSAPHGQAGSEPASEPVIGIYLKNLPQESVNEQMLFDTFSQFGPLKGGLAGISIVMSPRYLKVAYIKFETVAAKEAAMKASGMLMLGKAITVLAMLPEFCKAPGQGHPGGRGGRGSSGGGSSGGRGGDRFPGGYRNGGRGGCQLLRAFSFLFVIFVLTCWVDMKLVAVFDRNDCHAAMLCWWRCGE